MSSAEKNPEQRHLSLLALVLAVLTPFILGATAFALDADWQPSHDDWAVVAVLVLLIRCVVGVMQLALLMPLALAGAALKFDIGGNLSVDYWAVVAMVLLLCLVLVDIGVVARLRRIDDAETLVGAGALFAALLAGVGLAMAICQSWPDEVDQRFLLIALLVGAALFAAATDWSRRSLLGLGLLLGVAVAVVVTQIGVAALHEADEDEQAAQLESARRQLSGLQERADEADERAYAAADELARLLRAPVATVPPSLRTRAEEVRDTLDRVGRRSVGAARRALDRFDHEYDPTTSVAWMAQVREQAITAIDARAAADAMRPLSRDAENAVCAAAKAVEDRAPAGKLRRDDTCSATSEGDIDERLGAMDLALARLRFAVTGETEDEQALNTLRSGGTEPADEEITLLDGLTEGPRAILDDLLEGDGEPPLTPGPLGWAVLGLATLGAWAWLLRRNARQLAGPVDVPKPDGTAADLEDHVTELRMAVLENVAEPGAAPGSAATNPVTTLLGALGDQAGWVKQLVEMVLGVLGQVHGYVVTAEVITPKDESEAAETRVLVRVKDRHTSSTLATNIEHGNDPAVAVRAAGLWAAGFILNRSSRIPSWAAWNADTARALATANQEAPSLEDLEQAVQTAPNGGLLLYMLGNAYELAEQRHEALGMYARAVAAHPRYLLARYRLAAALGMTSHASGDLLPDDQAARETLLDSLTRALDGLGLTALAKEHFATLRSGNGDIRAAQRQLAKVIFDDLTQACQRRYLLSAALRRADREQALGVATSLGLDGRYSRLVWLIKSASRVYSRTKIQAVVDEANTPGTWWQVSYNAACARAYSPSNRSEAMGLLEQCLVRPGVHQLDVAWVRVDPDLKPLHDDPRFTALCRQLDGGGQR